MGDEPRRSVPSRAKRRRGRHIQTPKERARIQWMLDDIDGFHSAYLSKLCLGRLPKRAAKYGCINFDLEDEREYCGDDGAKVPGHLLAGIAARIVRCAKDPINYMFSLRDVPAKMIEPIKAYLRVKFAMGRLEAEIEKTASVSSSVPAREVPDHDFSLQTIHSGTSSEPGGVEGETPFPNTSKFKWHTSPAQAYGFKEMTEAYGYDPRDTSVYWIEKRAATLRRKWKNYGRKPLVKAETPVEIKPETVETHAPCIKYFEPADADYNSVWPPVEMPAGPPKGVDKDGRLERGLEQPKQLSGSSKAPDICGANSEVTDALSQTVKLLCQTNAHAQTNQPETSEEQMHIDVLSDIPALAQRSRADAAASGNTLALPENYTRMFGMSPSVPITAARPAKKSRAPP